MIADTVVYIGGDFDQDEVCLNTHEDMQLQTYTCDGCSCPQWTFLDSLFLVTTINSHVTAIMKQYTDDDLILIHNHNIYMSFIILTILVKIAWAVVKWQPF